MSDPKYTIPTRTEHTQSGTRRVNWTRLILRSGLRRAYKLTAGQMLVLLYLADRAGSNPLDANYRLCWPKQSTIAEDCDMSERSVRKIVDRLSGLRLIERFKVRKMYHYRLRIASSLAQLRTELEQVELSPIAEPQFRYDSGTTVPVNSGTTVPEKRNHSSGEYRNHSSGEKLSLEVDKKLTGRKGVSPHSFEAENRENFNVNGNVPEPEPDPIEQQQRAVLARLNELLQDPKLPTERFTWVREQVQAEFEQVDDIAAKSEIAAQYVKQLELDLQVPE